MAEGLRARLANPGILVLLGDDIPFAARLDPGKGQLFAQDHRKLIQRKFDFKDMAARLAAGAALAVARLRRSQGCANVATSLPYAPRALGAEAKLRNLDLRERNTNQIFPFLADHLAAAN